jgi:non-lysosomal glucosylceramidase
VRERGRAPQTRVVAARPLPPFRGECGLPRAGVPGLPHLRGARFAGTYPIARIDFRDDTLPVRVALEAFNPMIPLAPEDSGIPVAILTYRLTNTARRAVEATLVLSAPNPIGYLPPGPLAGRREACFGGNVNALVREQGFDAVSMTSERLEPSALAFGSMALAVCGAALKGQRHNLKVELRTWRLHWGGGAWFDDLQTFWDDLADDGRLAEQPSMEPTPMGETEHASLGVRVALAPRATAAVRFLLAWHFPNRDNHWNIEEAVRGARMRSAYALRFRDALDVVRHTVENIERLETGTRRFRDALFSSTLPAAVVDAVSSQMATLRTNSVLWLDDGRMHGFEGCNDSVGCCPMDCTHVWNYSQTEAFLYPTLARTMRETDFGDNVDDAGHMAFRTLLPLGRARWNWLAAADGQLGTLVRLSREWRLSGNGEWLRRLWPQAKAALAYALAEWDKDGDGLPDAVQHNTYDIELVGPNPLTGTVALAAYRAVETMAEAVGDREAAGKCRDLFARARRRLDELCWNGAFYEQRVDLESAPRYQFGGGCLSDQLLGEFLAMSAGLGPLLPPARVRKTLKSIFRHNWRADLTGHVNCQRSYALEGEAGLLLCTWPRGGRPAFPFPYSDEVWTGIEYQVAATMIAHGLVEEGLRIVEGARARHDGAKRNPWDEPECGHHYVRAMSSWGLLLALSGFRCSVPERWMEFAPRTSPEQFRCLWSSGVAWGVYSQRVHRGALRTSLEVIGGEMLLDELRLTAGRKTWARPVSRRLRPGDKLAAMIRE